jgi:midasin (ATPase involved in ribosome maturation)
MANEPDNLVLAHLREIRATLSEHSAHSARMNERFNQLDKRFNDFHALTGHTLMLATTSALKSQDLERCYEFSKGEQRRPSKRMDDFERRLSNLED